MALLTLAEEYQAVRLAIQALTTTSENVVNITVDGMTVQYAANQMEWLQDRENELANKICTRNRRKRTTPDFSYPS
jgi:hypothetical protein